MRGGHILFGPWHHAATSTSCGTALARIWAKPHAIREEEKQEQEKEQEQEQEQEQERFTRVQRHDSGSKSAGNPPPHELRTN